jgi:hypothetical protein
VSENDQSRANSVEGRGARSTASTPAPFGSPERSKSVPRLALSVGEACESLGCGWDFWSAHIAPEVRIVRVGAKKLVPVAELERWLADHAEKALD